MSAVACWMVESFANDIKLCSYTCILCTYVVLTHHVFIRLGVIELCHSLAYSVLLTKP